MSDHPDELPDGRGESLDPASAEMPAPPDTSGVRQAVAQLLDEVVTETEPKPIVDTSNLRGQVAIVSGASTGIGRAVALALARHGLHVGFCYLDDGEDARAAAVEVANELRQAEVRAYCRACDVRDSTDVHAFVTEVHEELGGIHVLVNNAGIGRDHALWRMEDSEWEAVLRTNLDGAFYFTRAVAPYMRAQEYGKIVNITSVHGLRAEFGLANYASSKAGLIGLTRASAVDLGSRNVNVNAVAPGYIRTTRLTDGVPSEILDRARERSALGRLGDPHDVAGAVLFLVSESARHITGVVIPVDGGYLL